MTDLFLDTLAGQVIRGVSGGRLCSLQDPTVINRPTHKHNDDSLASFDGQTVSTISVKEKGADFELVSWYGDDDPANPQNWSSVKKVFVTFLICFLTVNIYIGSAIYTGGEQGVMEKFHVSQTVATLGLTLFVLGYAIGPMFLAPLAEAPPIGRKPVYLVTLFIFVVLNFPVIYAPNIATLLVFRFLTGFIGSPVLATGGASLADLWSRKKVAIGIWGVAAVCGPVLGPLVGGFAAQHETWRWTIWELVWLSGFCLILLIFTLPETSANTILYKRAKRLRKLTGNPNLKSQADLATENMQIKDVVSASFYRPFQLCFSQPILLVTNAYLALVYALLFTWFEAFPIVFTEIYHFNLGENGLAFLCIMVGAIVIMIPYCVWLYMVQEKQFDEQGNIAPENRLPPAIVGSFFIPICMFVFGWSSRESVHWIVSMIGASFFPMGAVLLFNAILNYQADAYPEYVGSVLAGNDLIRCSVGSVFPLFAPHMFHQLGVDWASSLLGFLAIAFVPIPYLLYKYGKRIRMSRPPGRHFYYESDSDIDEVKIPPGTVIRPLWANRHSDESTWRVIPERAQDTIYDRPGPKLEVNSITEAVLFAFIAIKRPESVGPANAPSLEDVPAPNPRAPSQSPSKSSPTRLPEQ
ncbi:MFS general substrate transporter [Aureobasidium pullulans]|nr:MFS general substrate transporter [Aureobasidium pullulans]